MKRFIAAVAVLACLYNAPALARHHYAVHHPATSHVSSVWARPTQWCGWFMRKLENYTDPALNLARNWLHVGRPVSGPAPGVIGVMPHHVFKVVAVTGPGRVLAISGNDGHAVRTRERSTAKVIGWRAL